ncbi:MAG TPA: thioredoxin domain-containing protein, partial [Gammaproteobacteria bacterium]
MTLNNALADAPSPYLQQHADNPVAWQQWNAAALERARREDRPILLSIGYSACHWCHVMAHESFADPATAAVMNRLFVNIKVDREERPDLDKIYQLAHQVMHQRGGGWPLTVFLDPQDRMPFFTGTYFPPTPRHGLPGFPELLERVAEVFRQQRDAVRLQSGSMAEVLQRIERGPEAADAALDAGPLDAARAELARVFDAERGGFGSAPKFPQPPLLGFLLGPGRAAGGAEMALTTLRKMALGGIHDLVGGGFCRYSVDGNWMIPHFEKMLYDNAQLLPLYAEAARRTGEPLYRDAAATTVAWLAREMRDPAGGFYSALDADSEGHEGRFYVWERDELERLLEPDDFASATRVFRLDGTPNFEERWHLHRHDDGQSDPEFIDRLRATLFPARARRVPPGRDDKVLSAWNALLAAGLARAGRQLGRPEWVAQATATVEFLRTRQWHGDRLRAAWKEGSAYLDGYLDDHAFALDACLELLQAAWRREHLDFAIALAEALLARFEDPAGGGFFFTASDHEALITRPKPFGDDATPTGNGVAARALGRLGHLLGEPRYL